jgi:predicted AlkP superfamily pyrophosphatase or phosphodiesterase
VRFLSVRSQAALTVLLLGLWGTGPATLWAQETPAPIVTVENADNSAATLKKHYVILVSLDGFRYDYAEKYHAEHLLAMAKEGASAPNGMIPSYPTVTFPNHYSIVTGLYPEHHGIVANDFYDPKREATYRHNDPASVTDGSWYGGTPIWVLAEQQQMRSACFFWPGSEAKIQDTRPSYYYKFASGVSGDVRVAQALAWLRMPENVRPHLITLYFGDADHAGHEHGPDSDEVRAAVQHIDEEIGKLRDGLAQIPLPVDLVVLADHGMATVQGEWITLDEYFPHPEAFEKIVSMMLYPKSEADAESAYKALHARSEKFEVYRRAQFPAALHDDSNPRSGDPIIVTNGPYLVRFSAHPENADAGGTTEVGAHGFDPAKVPEMKASFFVVGPDIRAGASVPPFENINVYPFIAALLQLDIAHLKTGPIDGYAKVLSGILRQTKTEKKAAGKKAVEVPSLAPQTAAR